MLDEIEGIGPKKRDALLKAFGTSENIAKLDIEMLTTLPEISPALAANIHKYFKTHPIDNSPEE